MKPNTLPTQPTLDPIDQSIIRTLQADSRLSVRELAQRVHRSPTAVFERLRRLESTGIITGYTLTLNRELTGRGFAVFCNVKLKSINSAIHADFAAAMEQMPEVSECYNVSGTFDYLLKVKVPDMHTYRTFVTNRLGNLSMLDSVQSVFVMEQILHRPPAL